MENETGVSKEAELDFKDSFPDKAINYPPGEYQF